jgi:hypothetical protein
VHRDTKSYHSDYFSEHTKQGRNTRHKPLECNTDRAHEPAHYRHYVRLNTYVHSPLCAEQAALYCLRVLDIRFARSGEVDIAFHVVGEGPIDIVYVIGSYSHLQVGWELPAFRRFCEQLGEFARLIVFDKRGMGMSDRIQGATPLDVRMDDIGAVMDAAGSDSAVVMGAKSGTDTVAG